MREREEVQLLAALGSLPLEPPVARYQREQMAAPCASIPSVRLRFSPEKPRQAPILHPPMEAIYEEYPLPGYRTRQVCRLSILREAVDPTLSSHASSLHGR